jgi:hypothetical protein
MACTVLLAVISIAGALGQQPENRVLMPQGPVPIDVMVHVDEDGQLVIRRRLCMYFPLPARMDSDEQRPQQGTRKRTYEIVEAEERISIKEVRIYDTDLRRISAEKLTEAGKEERHALLSVDGKPVDPYYLQVVRDGTPIIVSRAVPDAIFVTFQPGAIAVSPRYGPPMYPGAPEIRPESPRKFSPKEEKVSPFEPGEGGYRPKETAPPPPIKEGTTGQAQPK